MSALSAELDCAAPGPSVSLYRIAMGNAQGVCSNGDAVPDGEDISDTKRRFSMPDMTAADEMLAQGKDGMASVVRAFERKAFVRKCQEGDCCNV